MRFILKLTLYALPFAAGFLLTTGWLFYAGETIPVERVAQMQQANSDLLYRPRYGAQDLIFKRDSANLRRAEVLALGSSRILQFRAGFFDRDPQVFYNAAAPAWGLDQIAALLYGLDPAAYPRVLILSIDPPWFNPHYHAPTLPDPNPPLFHHVMQVNRSFLQEVIQGEWFDFPRIIDRRNPGTGGDALGLRAIRDGHGFRYDGSEQYGDFLVMDWLYAPFQRSQHLEWLAAGQEMYAPGAEVSAEALRQLADVIQFAALHQIFVIGYIAPYMPTLWQQLTVSDQHGYLPLAVGQIEALLTQYGFAFFDFADGALLGAADSDFYDGWHASERVNLQLYRWMLAALPAQLAPYSSPAGLDAILAGAGDTWSVFDPVRRYGRKID